MVHTDLFLNVGSFIGCGSGQDAGVAEAGLQQRDDHEHKESSSDDRYAARQVFDQEGAAAERRTGRNLHLSRFSQQQVVSPDRRGVAQVSKLGSIIINQSVCSSFNFP